MINTLVPTGDVSTMSIYHSYSDFSLFTSELEKDNSDDVTPVIITPKNAHSTNTVISSTQQLLPLLSLPMTVTPVPQSSTHKHLIDEVIQNTTTTSATTTATTAKRAVYPSSTIQEVYYYTEPVQYSFEEYISAIARSCQYCNCSHKQQPAAVSTVVNPFLFSVTSASSSSCSSSTVYVDTTIVATTSSSDCNSNGDSSSTVNTTTTTTNTTTNNNNNSDNNNNDYTEESEWLNLLESLAGY